LIPSSLYGGATVVPGTNERNVATRCEIIEMGDAPSRPVGVALAPQ
jgi:hypothetical protein